MAWTHHPTGDVQLVPAQQYVLSLMNHVLIFDLSPSSIGLGTVRLKGYNCALAM